ncbi:MAG: hypothetical protein Q8936_02850 [Bacillota bacterium]|nr:hypothetical protein [Bacillota bacterium]
MKKKILSIFAILLVLNILFVGCDNKTIDIPPYTEKLIGTANLVDVDNYMFSELYNSSKDKTYYRFKINTDNKDSVDIEVTDIDCFPTYADNTNVDYKDKLGKVYMYERTYKLSDTETIKRNVYKVYVLKDKVKEVSMGDENTDN